MISRYSILSNPPKHIDGKKIKLEIPNKSYYIWVPQIAIYSEKELETFGIPKEGYYDDLQDSDVNKMILVRWPIVQMLEAFSSGYRIVFEYRKDIYSLNNDIEEFFDKVNDIINSYRVNDFEIDPRLEALDKFNQSIYTNNNPAILQRRKDIIKRASIESLLPDYIYTEVLPIEQKKIVSNTPEVRGRYTKFTSETSSFNSMKLHGQEPIVDNPLAPVYSQEPILDFSNDYKSRFIDHNARRAHAEHNRAKEILKNKGMSND